MESSAALNRWGALHVAAQSVEYEKRISDRSVGPLPVNAENAT
jgi:hypothetical protein